MVNEVPTSVDEWHAGVLLDLAVDVEVTRPEGLDLGCEVGGTGEGEPFGAILHCNCEASSGTKYTCERQAGEASCCFSHNGPRENVKLALRATQCSARCVAGLAQYSYCQQL